MKPQLSILALALSVSLFAGDKYPVQKSMAPAEVQAELVKAKGEKSDNAFMKSWKAADLKDFGLVKWDEDGSKATNDCPPSLLSTLRENVGLMNQGRKAGDALTLTVNAYHWKAQTFLTNPVLSVEIILKDKAGKVVFVALDQMKSSQTKAESLNDSDSQIMGRELLKKLKNGLGI